MSRVMPRAAWKAVKRTEILSQNWSKVKTTQSSLLSLSGPDGRRLRIDTDCILHLYDAEGLEVWKTDLKEMVGIDRRKK